jgi:hypothetical protein
MDLNKLIKESFRELLFEGQVQPFQRVTNTPEKIIYQFKSSGLGYECYLTNKGAGYPVGTYEVEFAAEGQESSATRVNKGHEHLNNVLLTCKAIMDAECKDKNIRTYVFSGAPDGENDSRVVTARANVYYRFFSRAYSKESVKINESIIHVDMTRVYPELFDVQNTEKSRVNTIAKLLLRASNKKPDVNAITSSIEGNETKFTVSTDELENTNYGGLDIDIVVDDEGKKYQVVYNKYDKGEGDSKEFTEFNQMISFMRGTLLN